ncbi:hypothetical protein QTH97_22800 [Variovorax sp. J22R24]|uniref:hypothetical protein n=1 Tax=Variovorax gracilis TaxID=3053502 RepID=UPI002576CCEB|nr:hypothetical protein [Variovorax sp. J22R24]MDM0107793.1 hypothetical protein [Variovorax sp. J22R24]
MSHPADAPTVRRLRARRQQEASASPAASAIVIPFERRSRSFALGRFRLDVADLGPAREYLGCTLKPRAFTTIWSPRPPTRAEREALHAEIEQAVHEALSEFSRALGHRGRPMLLGSVP